MLYTIAQRVDTLTLNDQIIWQRDTTPPEIPTWKNTPNANTNDITPTWEWNPVSDAVSYSYRLSTNGVWGNWVNTTSTSYTPTLSGNPPTQYQLQVKAVDNLGNESEQISHEILLDTVPPDPPVFIEEPPSPGADTTPTWRWGNVNTATHYAYRLSSKQWCDI